MITLRHGKRDRGTPCLLQGVKDRSGFSTCSVDVREGSGSRGPGLALMTSRNFMLNAQSDVSMV